MPTPARWPTPCMEKEVTPPSPQALPNTTRDYITWPHPENICHRTSTRHQEAYYTIFFSKQPAKKEDKTQLYTWADQIAQQPSDVLWCNQQAIPSARKYDLQEVSKIYPKNFKAIVVKVQHLPHPDETLSVDLPVFFMYHREQEYWFIIKGPTSKLYVEEIYTEIENKFKTGIPLENNISWYNFLEASYNKPEGIGHRKNVKFLGLGPELP